MDVESTTTWLDLLRHGEPAGGLRFRGLRDDPLTERGWEQLWQSVGEARWDLVLCSDLQRCRAFAEALAGERGMPLAVDARFREMDFGDWEGLRPADVPDQAAVRAFWADPVANPPPGGEDPQQLVHRVNAALNEWLAGHAGQRILLVCHTGVIRAAIAGSLKLTMADVMQGFSVPYACRTRLRVDSGPHGEFRAITAHGCFD